VFGLLIIMSIFTVQNALVLLFSCEVFFVRLLKSGINTAMFAVVAYLFVTSRGYGNRPFGSDKK
jgi:Na+/H+ antiporter NhaA